MLRKFKNKKKIFGPARIAVGGKGPDDTVDVVKAKRKLTFADMATPKGLADIARYAQWIGAPLRQLAQAARGRRLT